MRLAILTGLLFLAACGDPALRDRWLSARLKDEAREKSLAAVLSQPPVRKARSKATSVIGLVPDPMAPYYDDAALLVMRCADLATLEREAAPHLRAVRELLPELGLPGTTSEEVLRKVVGLPKKVALDPVRPFALIVLPRGWAAVLPTRSVKEAGDRLKTLDALYCVAGDPAVVRSYRQGFRKGFHLPGDCSLIAKPDAIAQLGKLLAPIADSAGMSVSMLGGVLERLPSDIERVDLSCRFGSHGLRLDVRAAPARGTPTWSALEDLKPGTATSTRWLPSGGTLYGEFAVPPLSCERLVAHLVRDQVPSLTPEAEKDLTAVRALLAALGDNAAFMVKLDPDGSGYVVLVAELQDAELTRSFLGSPEMQHVLDLIAGPKGKLEWSPQAFARNDRQVGSITGHISRERLLSWRKPGNIVRASLSMLLKGPAFGYAAVSGERLCLVAGVDSRAVAERVLDRLEREGAEQAEHEQEVGALFPMRLGALSVDIASLFDGCREAAHYRHPDGESLRNLALRWRLPAAAAITVEGGALRVAVRVRPRELAEAASRVRDALLHSGRGK